jgi:hypothetical protein
MRKLFLYLSNDHLIAVRWSAGAAQEEHAFAASESGRAGFAEFLQSTPPMPTYVLTDLIEEDFRLDTVPHVNARDRKSLLERKLHQLYRATPYRLAKIVGRLADGRRDDEVLLCALTNAELVQSWVDVLLEARVPVAGVYSVALITESLHKALQVKSKHALWVSLQANAGWRQTYCQDARVRFSRLTPITGSQSPAALLSEQIGKTVQYLESINSFTSEETLEVHVLSDRATQAVLRASLLDGGQLRYVFHDVAEAAKRVDLRDAPGGSEATPLYLRLLDNARTEQFAPSAQRRYADIRRVRMSMLGASVALALAGVVFGAWNLLQTQRLRANVEQIETTTRGLRAAHGATVAAFPVSKVNAQAMNEAVTYHAKLVREAPVFSDFARELSQVMNVFPAVHLERLVWGTDTKAQVELGYQAGTAEQTNPRAVDAPPGSYYQAAVIEAAVRPFDGNYRAALDEIERFSKALGAPHGAYVKALALPLDTRADTNLRGSATPEKALDEARFTLFVHLPPRQP